MGVKTKMNRTAVINFFVQPDYETERMTLMNSESDLRLGFIRSFEVFREIDTFRRVVKMRILGFRIGL